VRKCFEIQLSLAGIAKSKPEDKNCSKTARFGNLAEQKKDFSNTLLKKIDGF
jgi:hypothetical protein